MMSFVYGLVDPRTDGVRYIGKTCQGMKRLTQHVGKAGKGRTRKDAWLRSLAKLDLVCSLVILERVAAEHLCDAEQCWIAHGHSLGWRLTNLTDGGEGLHGYRQSDETKARHSLALKGKKYSPERLARYRELRAKLGPARPRGFRLTEEHKRKIQEANQGKYFVSEEGRKVTALAHSKGVIEMITGVRYTSIQEAAATLGLEHASVARVAHGKNSRTRQGYIFRFAK